MIKEEAIMCIIKYMECYIFKLDKACSYDEFMKWSFAVWSASDLINIIMDQPHKTLFEIQNEYMIKLLYYKSIALDDYSKRRLSIIYEVTDSIFTKLFMEERV